MSSSDEELLRAAFPGVPVKKRLYDNQTLHSIEKARNVLGFVPEYSWRDQVG
jgi:hypothetical protein